MYRGATVTVHRHWSHRSHQLTITGPTGLLPPVSPVVKILCDSIMYLFYCDYFYLTAIRCFDSTTFLLLL